MDRREFALAAGAGVVGIIFPRKAAAIEPESFSNEEMARIIFNHPRNVSLIGKDMSSRSTRYLGLTRHYHYADEVDLDGKAIHKKDWVDDWKVAGDVICAGYVVHGKIERKRFIHDCTVEVRSYWGGSRISWEHWYDISNPKLMMIDCLGGSSDPSVLEIPSRQFARTDQRWREL